MATKISTVFRCLGVKWGILAAVVLLFSGAAFAQVPPTTIFQLDGNAASDNLTCTYGTPCDYWNLLNGAGTIASPGVAGHSLVRTFINGTASTDSFQGGGSKDSNLISQHCRPVGIWL